MGLESLIRPIAETAAPVIDALRDGKSLANLGLMRSARLPVLAAIHSRMDAPVVLLTGRPDHALTLMEELGLWATNVPRLFFPDPNPLFYENSAWGENTRRDRLQALTTLATYHVPGAPVQDTAPIIVVPARALMARTMPRRDFLKASRTLKPGQVISPDGLARRLVSLGYQPATTVIAAGQFARRGGILDVWPPAERQPARLEFFGDEIDTLRRFDPATQLTVKTPASTGERLLVTPACEYQVPEPGSTREQELGLPEEVTEFHLPLIHPVPASLLDYLPQQALVAIDDLQAIQEIIQDVDEAAFRSRQEAIADGLLPADFPVPYLSWSEVRDALGMHQTVELGPVAGVAVEESLEKPGDGLVSISGLSERFTPGPRFGGRLKPLIERMADFYLDNEPVVIVSRQSARLQELWDESLPPDAPVLAAPLFVEDSLGEGWHFKPRSLRPVHLLTDGEIFGWRRPEPRRRPHPVAEAPEAAYTDLEVGDWVVHIDHGVGRFLGLVRRTVEGVEREYLAVEYADEAQLFVPVHQVDRLTRYVGPDSRPPSPSRLGGAEWRNAKSRVREAVKEVAEDLLDLYARRNLVEGYQFSPDTVWQQELEASFPYIETEDQIQVLDEVKIDMESPRPMDRLICGDVGYGKTEVALRAAFKAVMDGKQVAMLVPTTVLAQQHYQTFQQRLAAFPVEVEMLSRFRTPQQQRAIIERMVDGSVDIVIGTHRLLSSDVTFKDLGLLIIDEEQRFGVTHKENLKKLRTEVDVLTMTATPIPRTLYMALSGVRDISTINTPPEERLPVITHVGPYSPKLVRQAILRELERGGQVFFVHNRVQTIGGMRHHLERLVPEARITVAHGQMQESDLSHRMEQFTEGEVDVLLSTSIIESGLDIPSANTLIVDRADTFGLAQLYQLRGRVGRGAQRAYAYFFRHNRIRPTLEARQRLETIAENTQLGAGLSIAMRDLEIRGAGDILGTRQHGHIASVGFHLYTRLLASAVRKLRKQQGLPVPMAAEKLESELVLANVELPLPASIPAGYVPDTAVRLGLYRRMADVRLEAEIDALAEEFQDRFGPLPDQVENLLLQLKVKLLAERAGLSSVSSEGGQFVLRFANDQDLGNLPPLGRGVRVGRSSLWMPYKDLPDWRTSLVEILEKLARAQADQQG